MGRSHVKKRRHGCLTGCLLKIVLLLGLAALLFVGACVLGFVQNDPVTGAPSLTLDGLEQLDLSQLPDIGAFVQSMELPTWAYGVSRTGLTVKTLRAGSGEAVLVCADGYTMLLGGGSGMGVTLVGQLLLSGVRHLNAVVAMSSSASQIGGLPLAITLMPPQYLLFQDSQTKGAAYNRLMAQAEKSGSIQRIVPEQGLSFALGRAQVTIIGPAHTPHTDERDDSLSVRVDYGQTSVLIMGEITQAGEQELITSRAPLDADALICAQGGGEDATCAAFVQAVSPSIALMTAREAENTTRIRLTRAGAQVYTAQEHGVMTLVSDGTTIQVRE